jgi:hypothetical protein
MDDGIADIQHQATGGLITPHPTRRNAFRRKGIHFRRGLQPFAEGRRKDMMLKALLAETGTESLHAYCASIANSRMPG